MACYNGTHGIRTAAASRSDERRLQRAAMQRVNKPPPASKSVENESPGQGDRKREKNREKEIDHAFVLQSGVDERSDVTRVKYLQVTPIAVTLE